jgi:hypothetical protein
MRRETETPYRYSRAALDSALKDNSGFQDHPTVSVVTASLDEVVARLRKLCDS